MGGGEEYGTVGIAIVSSLILAFGLWIIQRITRM